LKQIRFSVKEHTFSGVYAPTFSKFDYIKELNFEDEDSNSANAKNAGGYDSVENDEYQPPLGKVTIYALIFLYSHQKQVKRLQLGCLLVVQHNLRLLL
jgi:hypothetical protein